MTTTIQAVRSAAAIGVFAAVVLATGTPRTAAGHEGGDGTGHVPEAPQNIQVQGIAGTTENVVGVTWEASHAHQGTTSATIGYELNVQIAARATTLVFLSQGIAERMQAERLWCQCTRITGFDERSSFTAILARLPSGLRDVTVTVAAIYGYYSTPTGRFGSRNVEYLKGPNATANVTVFGTETPDPETPTTPEPEPQSCTYKHRVIGVYGARTTNTYSAEVIVSSEVKGASIEIRAYQGSNGTELDVLDRNGSAVGPNVTLGAAHSLQGFRPEGAAGRHTVIVKHPTKAAMDNATVALQLRGPEVGFQVVPVPGIERCTTASTTTESRQPPTS